MRLIDADALHHELTVEMVKCARTSTTNKMTMAERVLDKLDEAPTIEAEPVRHGRWKLLNDGNGICSECKCRTVAVWDFDNSLRYCPHCGATMD